MMIPEHDVVAIDFDDTMGDKGPVIDALKSAFGEGVPEEVFYQSLKLASRVTYSPGEHLRQLQKSGYGSELSEDQIEERVAIELSKLPILFSDVQRFIDRARGQNYRVGIVTYGNSRWQLLKIYASRLQPMDFILHTEERGMKAKVLKQAFPTTRVVFIDDSREEVEEVSKLRNCQAWLINRRERPLQEGSQLYRACSSLEEVVL